MHRRIGDTVDLEGFLYWYEGPQPHISAVKQKPSKQVMSFEEFTDAAIDSPVVVNSYVQLAAYNAEYGNVSFFMQDPDGGAYFVYRMNVTPEQAALLVPGAAVQIKGFKSE